MSINEVPDELIPFILIHLGIRDLIRCREVSKRFRLFSNECMVSELVLSIRWDQATTYWFDTNKTIDYEDDAISLTRLESIKSIFIKLEKGLKRLHLNLDPKTSFNLSSLSIYQNLEQLDIVNRQIGDIQHRIDLPNLLSFSLIIKYRLHNSASYVLQAPKLNTLRTPAALNLIHLSNEEKLKRLYTDFYNRKILSFRNLEYLRVFDSRLNSNILVTLQNLKHLDIVPAQFAQHRSPFPKEPTFRRMISLIMKQRLELRRIDLTVSFANVKLKHNSYPEQLSKPELVFEFQMNHYSKLCGDLSYNTHLNYAELIQHANGRIPSDFNSKFFNIQSVEVNGENVNEEQLSNFLKKLDHLNELLIRETSLSQSFYDRLPDIKNDLVELEISDTSKSFDFLSKFKSLKRFSNL